MLKRIVPVLAVLSLAAMFFVGRYTINRTVEDFQANVAALYQKAERAVTGWFRPAARTDVTA